MAASYCVCILFLLFGSNWSLDAPPSAIEVAFRSYDVMPDSIMKTPKGYVKVEYGNVQVILGNVLVPDQVQQLPMVSWLTSPFKFYTLVCVDLDSYTRYNPNVSEVRQWLVCNIPGDCLSRGDVISPYVAPKFVPGASGIHRIVFLVFEQIEKLTFVDLPNLNLTTSNRERFSVRRFTKEYNLGNPVAGNFYRFRMASDVC